MRAGFSRFGQFILRIYSVRFVCGLKGGEAASPEDLRRFVEKRGGGEKEEIEECAVWQ